SEPVKDFSLPDAYPYVQDVPEFQTTDYVYDPYIRTVRLYPDVPILNARQLPPIVTLRNPEKLVLEFDELGNEVRNYAAKLIHCNADWTVSRLFATEYLDSYNEFNFFDYEFSINTKTPYIHYRFELPQVLASGNYILKVYLESDEEDLILTRRFMVYDNQVNIEASRGSISGVEAANLYQQLDLTVGYKSLNINYPRRQIQATIRQNDRWDNAIMGLAPNIVRDFQQELEFRYFNLENAFLGGNEFRVFDLRSIVQFGFGMESFESFPDKTEVVLNVDRPREGWVYDRRFPDQNGDFQTTMLRSANADTEGDYAYVTFQLNHPRLPEGKAIYVYGELTDWRVQPEFKLSLDPEKGVFTGTALLKQGFYDYEYVLVDEVTKEVDERALEGSFLRTQNLYDVLIYYRPLAGRADQLVGYWRRDNL
ncbi:MAG: type IX secretion system plug protein domain-containing protein, partial [Bacteroidota bacterium]